MKLIQIMSPLRLGEQRWFHNVSTYVDIFRLDTFTRIPPIGAKVMLFVLLNLNW